MKQAKIGWVIESRSNTYKKLAPKASKNYHKLNQTKSWQVDLILLENKGIKKTVTGVLEHKLVVHICSNRLQLTVVSRDLYQADKNTVFYLLVTLSKFTKLSWVKKVVILSRNICIFMNLFSFAKRNRLRTPNEGINQRYLKNLADVADKICFGRT